jgi:RimJ/RimL family protein N-acetyltransferase
MITTPPPGRRAAAAPNCCEDVGWEARRSVYDDQVAGGVRERRIGLMDSLHAAGERAPGDRVEIAPVRLRHAEALRRVFGTIARERRYLPVFEAPPLDDVRRYIQDAIEKDDPAIVALGGDAVVGWCDIRRDAQPTGAHRGVLGMGVVPPWRGRGVGSHLIEAALGLARERCFVRIELEVYADNLLAMALYKKFGFVQEGVRRDAIAIDGRYCDSILLAIVDRTGVHD